MRFRFLPRSKLQATQARPKSPQQWKPHAKVMTFSYYLLLLFMYGLYHELLYLKREHHSCFQVFGDMAMRHPFAGIGDIEKDINILPRGNKLRIFPYEIRFLCAVPVKHQKLLAVKMH